MREFDHKSGNTVEDRFEVCATPVAAPPDRVFGHLIAQFGRRYRKLQSLPKDKKKRPELPPVSF
jgi:hypothetical protein